MPKIVQVSNDIESGFYKDGQLICQCEPDELGVVFRALGFDFEIREAFELEVFPQKLEEN